MIYFKAQHKTTMDQHGSIFLLVLIAILCNMIWPLFNTLDHHLPPEPNFRIPLTSTPSSATTTKWCMLVIDCSRRPVLHSLHNSSLMEKHTKVAPYHIPSGTLTTNELPHKWMENEEVLCWLIGEVKLPPPSNQRSIPNVWPITWFLQHPSFLASLETHKRASSRILPMTIWLPPF